MHNSVIVVMLFTLALSFVQGRVLAFNKKTQTRRGWIVRNILCAVVSAMLIVAGSVIAEKNSAFWFLLILYCATSSLAHELFWKQRARRVRREMPVSVAEAGGNTGPGLQPRRPRPHRPF